ncbi:MAG TPA: Ig-like domain-containing protein, partial [Spirochaetia bacterium]
MSGAATIRGLSAFVLLMLLESCALFDFDTFSVVSWSPREETLATVGVVVVEIRFSRSVNRTLTEQAFSMTADGATLQGRVSWTDDVTLVFTPDEPLRDLVVYTMHVSTAAEDTEGRDLTPAFDHTFTTRTDFSRPTVVGATPADHASVTDTLSAVTVTFSKAMDKASVDAAFSLSPSVTGFLTLSADGKTLTFTPSQAMLWQTSYTVTVGKSAADTQHNTLGSDFTSHFYTGVDRTPPSMASARSADSAVTLVVDDPNDAALTVTPDWEADTGLVLSFSEPVLTSSAQTAVTISPSVQSTVAEANTESTSTLSFAFPERLVWGTTYTLTIGPGVTDLQGNKTAATVVYHFVVNGVATKPPAVGRVYYPSTPGDPSTNAEL